MADEYNAEEAAGMSSSQSSLRGHPGISKLGLSAGERTMANV